MNYHVKSRGCSSYSPKYRQLTLTPTLTSTRNARPEVRGWLLDAPVAVKYISSTYSSRDCRFPAVVSAVVVPRQPLKALYCEAATVQQQPRFKLFPWWQLRTVRLRVCVCAILGARNTVSKRAVQFQFCFVFLAVLSAAAVYL